MEYISCSIHILVYHDLHECWFLLTISDLSLLVSWFARTSQVVWWIFPKMNMKKSCQILVHTETLSFQFLPYCHYISSPAQILWRISKPGRLSWTCPLYSFENLHAPTSPLERMPLLLASLRKPEKKWKNKLSTWIFTGGNFSKILLLTLSYNSLQKGKLKIDHSKTSVLGLHRPETMENIGCIRLLPPRLVQDISSIYLLFGK